MKYSNCKRSDWQADSLKKAFLGRLSLLVVLAVTVVHASVVASEPTQSPENLLQELVSQRAELTQRHLCGVAHGTLIGWAQTAGESQPQQVQQSQVVLVVDEPRYCIQILQTDPPDSPNAGQRLEVVLYDGQTIYTFSSHGNSRRGGIYFDFAQASVLRSAGYPFSTVLRYWDDALNLKEVDAAALRRRGLESGGTMLVEDRHTYHRQIFLSPENDYAVQRVALRHPNATAAFREHWLTWAQADETKYVRNYVVRYRYATREPPAGQVVARQFEIDIQQFTPRQQIENNMLSVVGLGIPAGTRFIDYRRNVSGRRVQVEWDGSQFVDLTDPK